MGYHELVQEVMLNDRLREREKNSGRWQREIQTDRQTDRQIVIGRLVVE